MNRSREREDKTTGALIENHDEILGPQMPIFPTGREVLNLAHWRISEPGSYKTLNWLFIVIVIALTGCFLFFSGFCHDVDYTFPVINLGNFDYSKCGPQTQDRDNFLTPGAKVVFMVVDAWKYDFLASSNSPMKFTRKSIETGKAILFKGVVQPPTVTMPRIKAMTSGIIPSFAQAVYNFFTSQSTVDSWVKRAYDQKKRIFFYGDDTWVKLFPNYFAHHQGVPSFNVQDYIEIDKNVTSNMRKQLNGTEWDVLILHYLGLDHIGHFLGAKSSKIKPKLTEMDNVISEIYTTLSETNPVIMVVIGDHGMNDQGAHGGASQDETEVPIVIFNNKAKVINTMKLGKDEPYDVFQVDIATTMSEFLRIPLPERTRGVSLLPLIQKYWYLQYKTLLHSNVRLCIQLSRYVKHAKSVEQFLTASHKDDKRKICSIGDSLVYPSADTIKTWSRELQQRILRSVDETWEVASYSGLVLVGVIGPLMMFNDIKHVRMIGFRHLVNVYHVVEWFLLLTPVLSCFASSLVEEEHDIWNYFTSAAVVIRAFQVVQHALCFPYIDSSMRIRQDTDLSREKRFKRAVFIMWNACVVLFCHRFSYAFGASNRRRWKMDAELLPKPIYNDPTFLKSLLWLTRRFDPEYLFGRILPGSSFIFSGIYLISVLQKYLRTKYRGSYTFQSILPFYCFILIIKGISFVFGFNELVVPVIMPLSLLLTLLSLWISPTVAVFFYLLYLVKPEQQILLVLAYELGVRAKAIYIDRYFFCIMLYATFFYAGTSNKLESIDINAGYFGISNYNVVIVGFQIFMNTFAPTIVFLLSYTLYSTPEYNVLVNPADQEVAAKIRSKDVHINFFYIIHFRVLLAGAAMTAMQYFSGHLFVWSVFAPKALFEVMHCVIVLIVAFIFTIFALCAQFCY